MESITTQLTVGALPALGQALLNGIFAGLTTSPDGTHAAVVLLADKPSGQLAWKDAMRWAEEVGGALPTRPVAALLFANVKGEFEADWHWTADEHSASYAWLCNFYYGNQFFNLKCYEGHARAVRLIPLAA
jgi:hypothetical protein